MANADAPGGFKALGNLDGSPYNGGTMKCVILGADTTNTFIGDAVDIGGSSDSLGRYPSVVQHAAGGPVFGVISSFDVEPTNLELQYALGSQTTDRYCNVVPALDNVFEIQDDGDSATFVATNVGEAVDIVVGTGSTVTGMSAMELNTSDMETGDTCLILGITDAPDNEIGANVRIKIRFNESFLRGAGTPT